MTGFVAGIVLAASLTQGGYARVSEIEGASGAVFSPDGRRLAFERQVGWDRHLGVVDLASGEVTWIEKGPGMAGLASWGADGSLIYTAGVVTNTAFEAYLQNGREGYGIRIWKDGVKRDFN